MKKAEQLIALYQLATQDEVKDPLTMMKQFQDLYDEPFACIIDRTKGWGYTIAIKLSKKDMNEIKRCGSVYTKFYTPDGNMAIRIADKTDGYLEVLYTRPKNCF